MNLIDYAETDLDAQLAYNAHASTSLVPEKRAKQEVRSYVTHMAALEAALTPFATDANLNAIRRDLQSYRDGYLKRKRALLAAQARCVSVMVTGPSNFPTARNQKRNATANRRLQELVDWSEKEWARLLTAYDPKRIANAPISADDPDAIAKLQAKIDAAVAQQERMKTANKICRSTKLKECEKRERLEEMGYGAKHIEGLLHPDWGSPGFKPFELSNNNANIRRMQARIEELRAAQARPEAEDRMVRILGEPVRVSENRNENRLQLFFDGKPPQKVRDLLKRHGFHRAPSQGAWQRQLTDAARNTVDRLVEVE